MRFNACLRVVFVATALFGFTDQSVSAQTTIDIVKLAVAPTIDGSVDSAEWSAAALVDEHFTQIEPEFGAASPYRTVVRIAQTDTALYVAFEAFDPNPGRISAAATQRDGGLNHDDSVAVLFDTFGDKRTAYLFRTNALATQQDGRIADNGRTAIGNPAAGAAPKARSM